VRTRDSLKEDLSILKTVVKEREKLMIEAKGTAEVAQNLSRIDVQLRDAQLNLVWARVSEKEELLKSQKEKALILSEKFNFIEKEIEEAKFDEASAAMAHEEFITQRRSLDDSITEKEKRIQP
jgi:TPP-dependent indolepyruvate ferredoxin oxidoreductase alpha subunit